MTTPTLTIDCAIPGRRRDHGNRRPQPAPECEPPPSVSLSRLPRVSRLMALALRFDQLLHDGSIADYAALARLGHVSRARISQIMNLLLLAPDIQEALLFLPSTQRGRDLIHLGALQALAALPVWQQQRRLWQTLLDRKAPEQTPTHQP
jgi:hypothetical protein